MEIVLKKTILIDVNAKLVMKGKTATKVSFRLLFFNHQKKTENGGILG